MNRIVSSVIVSLLVVAGHSAYAGQLRILVAAHPSVLASNPDIALDVIDNINGALSDARLLSRRAVSASGNDAVSTNCGAGPHVFALTCGRLTLWAQRESTYADVVMLVVPTFTDGVCGAAEGGWIGRHPFSPGIVDGRDKYVFAAAANDCVLAHGNNVFAHEFGHLLYLEHQYADSWGNNDSDPHFNTPVTLNHAIAHYEFGIIAEASVMATNLFFSPVQRRSYSVAGLTFPSGRAKGHYTYADAARYIHQTTWNIVAAYRPDPPAPPPCLITFEFGPCNGPVGNPSISASLPGYEVLLADYDVRIGSGLWSDIFEGVLTCPSYPAQFSSIARAILHTQFGISECRIYVPAPDCQSNPW